MNLEVPEELMTLGRLLQDAAKLPWNHAVYLPAKGKWDESTECLVLDPNDLPDDVQEAPRAAKERGFRYALGVSAVQDIVANAREQRPEAAVSLLVRAFLFYYDHDAFIEF